MALTPDVQNEVLLEEEYTIGIYPSKTYYMNLDRSRIQGNTDEIESIPQAIYCVLNTERSKYLAYSDNYGIEFEELYGKPITYVIPELERRIKEALEWDTRIDSVDDFVFEEKGNSIHVTFTVHTIYGDVEAERTVDI